MSTETKVLTAHVPLGLAEKVEAMASRLERSRGWVMKQALAAWVDQEEERHKMTLEALEDVDAGRVIDHQAITAWADSLGTDKPLPRSDEHTSEIPSLMRISYAVFCLK